MLVFDVHGYSGSAYDQMAIKWGSTWALTGMKNNFLVLWPDGMGDNPWGVKSWDVSSTVGPKGRTCPVDRYWPYFSCPYSCSSCDVSTSCEWNTCHDDIGFIEFAQQEVTNKWCVDLDQMHLSGFSNGGMMSYYVASFGTDALGM